MKCPVCTDIDLAMTDRQGIEIDYCPRCRGIWLDRGELDRLIERAERSETAPVPPPAPQAPPSYPPREQHGYSGQPGHHSHSGHHDHYKKKHKSLIGELFDF